MVARLGCNFDFVPHNNMKKYILLIASLFAASLFAENVTLTNAETVRVFAALRSTRDGVSAANTRNGALNINALRPFVEAFEAGQQVIAGKAAKVAQNDPQREEKLVPLTTELTALSKMTNTVNLTLFTLSDEELKDAKVTMDAFSEFLRFLQPATSTKK